jgi:DNA (cytosine-5)-methyltransferase 1
MKVLNLYAGIGGNRRLWGKEHQITAIELDPDIAAVYAELYPNDEVIVGDAHEYLLDNYKNFDYIWSSPPCQSHSSFRFNINVRYRGTKPVYPDMKLYQEIILLSTHFEGKYVVENVKPYYDVLIKPTVELQRHYFWSNYEIQQAEFKGENLRTAQIPDLEALHGVDLSNYKLSNKRQVLRNCILPDLGLHVFRHAV